MRDNPLNTTDSVSQFSLEILQEHRKLVLKYRNAMKALGGVGKKPSHTLLSVEEMARSNLRAYERCHSITEKDNHLL
jgi:hypothetical protein